MGDLGLWANAFEAGILATLGTLMLVRNKGPLETGLGLCWLVMALYDCTLVLLPHNAFWDDWGSYLIFIAGMIWVGAISRLPQHQ